MISTMLYIAGLLVIIVIYLIIQFSLFVPEPKGLRGLLYHKVIPSGKSDFLSVTASQLEKQLQYMLKKGYNIISLSQCINCIKYGTPLPKKPLLLTFDDGYKNNFTELYPLLVKYKMKAAIFLVSDFIQSGNSKSQYLNAEDIKKMDPGIVEF